MINVPTKLYISRSQLREQICQTSKSDQQEWQSSEVLNGTNISLKGTNISFLKFICGTLNRGVANSVWNHVIPISSIQMYFQDIYSNLWKVKLFSGDIYSLKSNTFFWGTVMFVQDGFLYLMVTRHKLTVYSYSQHQPIWISWPTVFNSLRHPVQTKLKLSCTDSDWYLHQLNSSYLLKGIDRPFGGGVESILIRSVFVNWRLGKFFYLILNGLHHKISKKLLYAA